MRTKFSTRNRVWPLRPCLFDFFERAPVCKVANLAAGCNEQIPQVRPARCSIWFIANKQPSYLQIGPESIGYQAMNPPMLKHSTDLLHRALARQNSAYAATSNMHILISCRQ